MFEDLTFQINGINVTIPAESYIERYYDEDHGYYCYIWLESNDLGDGFSFKYLLGDTFMRNYYIYHDANNLR